MAKNFKAAIQVDTLQTMATIIPHLRSNGMYFEVNIPEFPRFYMKWSALGRYDLAPEEEGSIPYPVVLAVSDAIEQLHTR